MNLTRLMKNGTNVATTATAPITTPQTAPAAPRGVGILNSPGIATSGVCERKKKKKWMEKRFLFLAAG